MAYQVDKFNGQFLTSVEDGTIDTTTDIRFVGKNYSGYGEVQNENFLHMLENFANTTAPPKAVTGQIWYDSANKKLKFYDGSKFKIGNGAEVSATAPSGLEEGEFWWDNSTKQLYTWSGTEFILVGPEASPDLGASSVSAQVVKDNGNTNHTILKMSAGGRVVAIVSQTAFTLNTSVNPIEDFTDIKKGITLAKTNTSGVSNDNFIFWGSASNALRLGDVPASDFLQKGEQSFTDIVGFGDNGFKVGGTNDATRKLQVYIDTLDEDTPIVFESLLLNPIEYRITNPDTDVTSDIYKIDQTGVVPGANNTFDLGFNDPVDSDNNRYWKTVYATTFVGNVTGDVTGSVSGQVSGNVLATDDAVLVNTSTKEIGTSESLVFGRFIGTVTGDLEGTAQNASSLSSFTPSITLPTTTDKQSVPVRDVNGDIYVRNVLGTAQFADRIKIDNSASDTDPNYKTAKTTATANTIAARDGSGDLYANLFQGTATAARYADLAEKYLTDKPYDAGTVVKVGGEAEVTSCTQGSHVIGVVSTNPAYMMNKDLEGGTYIALKGRVPVKTGGKVKKGDTLIAGQNGYAVAGNESHVFAVALESSNDESVKLIEAVIL